MADDDKQTLPTSPNEVEVAGFNLAYIAIIANLGSFLFGFDFGSICWFLTSADNYTDDDGELYFKLIATSAALTGLIAAGAAVGAASTYICLLFWGNGIPKRNEIILAAFLYFVGALLESSSGYMSWSTWHPFSLMIAGRLIYGAGIATSFHSVPIYVSEMVPAHLRGKLGASTEAMICSGVLVSYAVGYCYQSTFGWIVTFRVAYIIALVMGFLALRFPHTAFYMLRGGFTKKEVLESMKFVLPSSTEADVDQLQNCIDEEIKDNKIWIEKSHVAMSQSGCSNLVASAPPAVNVLLTNRSLNRCLLLGVTLVTLQIFTGQAAIFYYAGDIFDSICPSNPDDYVLGLAAVKLLAACSMLVIGDSFGRRQFLIGGIIIMISGLIILIFGFRYSNSGAAVSGLYISVIGFEVSLGVMLWIMLSEIFPRFVRSAANSICVAFLYTWLVVITFTLPFITAAIGLMYVFVIFTCASTISLFLVYLFVPETSGVDIEVAYKLVKGQCKASLAPVGVAVVDDDDDATVVGDDEDVDCPTPPGGSGSQITFTPTETSALLSKTSG